MPDARRNLGQPIASATSFLAPRPPATLVDRPRLADRVGPDTGAAWTLVVGPPGGGKSTLVRSWLGGREEPWTWVALEATPERRTSLVELVVRGVQRALQGRPLDAVDALDMDEASAEAPLELLVGELADDSTTVVLVLDDAHLLDTDEWVGLAWLLRHLPPTLHLVVISRTDPPFPLGRERASGHMTEVRGADLAFDLAETEALADVVGVAVPPGVLRSLQGRTEGWAAGVRLAVLALRNGADPEDLIDRMAGSDSSVAEFLVEEVLDRLPPDRREFVEAGAILAVLDGDLCDAVTGRSDSGVLLRELASDYLFVTPVGLRSNRYRFHPLLAELLRNERQRRDPAAVAEEHRRAADWLVANDRAIEAIEHLLAAGEHARAHQLVVDSFQTLYVGMHRRDLDRWLTAIPDAVLMESLDRSVAHCVALALMANPDAGRWWWYCAERVGPDDAWASSRLECVLALGEAVHARLAGLREHWALGRALRPEGLTDPLDEIIAVWAVRLEAFFGDPERALTEARALTLSRRELLPDVAALSMLAGAMEAAGDRAGASALASSVVQQWRAADEPALVSMIEALLVEADRVAAAGDRDAADELVEIARALPPPRVGPHFLTAVLEIGQARIDRRFGDPGWQGRLVALAEGLRAAGAFEGIIEWVERTRLTLAGQPEPRVPMTERPTPTAVGSSTLVEELTSREVTILEQLASHRSLPEIGDELFISRHTVKSHVTRIYRKLGVSSRSGAVREARRLGILAS